MDVVKHGNYVFEEILNSVSHGIAFLGAVIGGNMLISEAVDVYKTDYHFWACVLYSFALMFLFLSSCLYHSFFMLPTSKSYYLASGMLYLISSLSLTASFLYPQHPASCKSWTTWASTW